MTKPRAYSYVRFSTPEQVKGKSLERQTEAAAAYCRSRGMELDTELSLHDLGVSAFRGKNADTGSLGAFLKAVHAGAVHRGSFLLIETFDRMSRESAYDAQLTLQNIINAGITVVTLLDGKQYNVDILRADPIALIYAILLMSRSHEESATKSKRIGDAWRRKRREIHQGKTLTAVTPGWIELDEKRKPRLIPRRAKLVKRMFEIYLAEGSKYAVIETFNREKMPTFKGGRYWTLSYVRKVLSNASVCGDFQPHREDTSKRVRTRIPDGPPITGYFPAVVDRKTFDKVQKLLGEQAKKRAPPRKGRTAARSMLASLAVCTCGDAATRVSKPYGVRYVCNGARHGMGCKYKTVRVDVVERTLIDNAAALFDHVPETDEDLGRRIAEIEKAVSACDLQIRDLVFLLDGTPSRTVAQRIQDAEQQRDQHKVALEALQARVQQSGMKRMREYARAAKSALLWHKSDPTDVLGCNSALRECFSKVIIDFHQHQMALHWRHGPVSTLSY